MVERSTAYSRTGRAQRCRTIGRLPRPTGTAAPLGAAHRRRRPRVARGGFTLIEVLIVVTIMAIVAGAGITAMEESATDAKDATLAMNLRGYRVQIELFKAQHSGNAPGWTGANPKNHLRLYTNYAGSSVPEKHPLFPYGPYIPAEGIFNPFNNGTALQISANPAGETPNPTLKKAGELVGWFYDPATGRIAPNAAGSTSTGNLRISM